MSKNKSGYSDVDTLIAAQTIAKSFKKDHPAFMRYGSEFSAEYADALLAKLKQTSSKYLGMDKLKAQISATGIIKNTFETTKDDMLILKSRIKTKFPKTKDEIYRQLGLHINLKEIHNKKQEALIDLLFDIKVGLEDKTLFDLLVANQIPEAFLNDLKNHPVVLEDAELNQESEKLNAPLITEEVSEIIYLHYQEVNGICEIAKIIYRGDRLMLNKYTWSYIIDQLHSDRKNKKQNPTDDDDTTTEENTDEKDKNPTDENKQNPTDENNQNPDKKEEEDKEDENEDENKD